MAIYCNGDNERSEAIYYQLMVAECRTSKVVDILSTITNAGMSNEKQKRVAGITSNAIEFCRRKLKVSLLTNYQSTG